MAAPLSILRIILVGLLGLASAMGIGRFAFTPLLPLMQQTGDISLLQGSWLASANYFGYLAGALSCVHFLKNPAKGAALGLLTVGIVTLAMAWPTQSLPLWLLWRFLAGVASAFVLVGISAWCAEELSQLQLDSKLGWVYAGVGVGIMTAGLATLLISWLDLSAQMGWLTLGILAFAVWLVCQPSLKAPSQTHIQAPTKPNLPRLVFWRIIFCYAVFGIGYILPATFLPAIAKAMLNDGLLFGWVWPVFGLAAAGSTLLVSHFFARAHPISVWIGATLVLTLGVALPLFSTQLMSLLIAAICVGGTFMVITQAGLQFAKQLGGARFIAAMTSAFATGQMIGPLLLNVSDGDFFWPSLIAGTLLIISVFLLLIPTNKHLAAE